MLTLLSRFYGAQNRDTNITQFLPKGSTVKPFKMFSYYIDSQNGNKVYLHRADYPLKHLLNTMRAVLQTFCRQKFGRFEYLY